MTRGSHQSVAAVCVAAILWALALQQAGGHATRYWAVPISLATFLAVQLLVPRVRWNRDRVLGPGNVAAMLFLQLVVIPTLLVLSDPFPGSLRFIPADQYINTALMLQAVAYACYAGGYVAWTKPVRPRPFCSNRGLRRELPSRLSHSARWRLRWRFRPLAHSPTTSGGRATSSSRARPPWPARTRQFLRPFLAYGVIILWAARLARRRPGARLQPLEMGLIVVAIGASATYNYNRGVRGRSATGPRHGLQLLRATAVTRSHRGIAGDRRCPRFHVRGIPGVSQGTHGGAINPAEAGLDQPDTSFADNLQGYGNGPQFWAVIVQEVDKTGMRHSEALVSSAMDPVPVLGKRFRNASGTDTYNELIYGEPDISDQILPFGAELYWNFGPSPGSSSATSCSVSQYAGLMIVSRWRPMRWRPTAGRIAAHGWR